MKKLQLQQGDINIITDSIPPGAKPKPDNIVRQGETTGHAHIITGSDFKLLQLGGKLFARIQSGDCRIIHEEHKPIELPVGEYQFLPVHEYDHFAEESRIVRD